MTEVIRSPLLSDEVRVLRTPKARTTERAAPAAASEATDEPGPAAATAAATADPQALAASLAEAEQRALRAENELAELRAREGTAFEAARQQGAEAGHAEGQRIARDEVAAELDALRSLFANASAELERWLTGREDFIAEAVLAAAGRVLGDALATPEGVTALVRRTCRDLEADLRARVRLAPDDVERLRRTGAASALRGGLELVPDATIELGGCIVEGDFGSLDARLDHQLEVIKSAVRSARCNATATESR